jgi:hypothetical protein
LKEYRAAGAANSQNIGDRIADAAKILGDAGVKFVVPTPLPYNLVLNADDLIRYFPDPDGHLAKVCEVTRQILEDRKRCQERMALK